MVRTLHRLTARAVTTAAPGMHADGGGLWLRVQVGLTKFWAINAASTAVRGKNCTFALWIGYNDLTVPVSAAQIYANITTYVGYAHSIACKVTLATESEGVNFAPLSTLIRANTTGADTIVDLAADPIWAGGYTTQPFTSYPHPTSYGYGYGFVASDFAAALNAQPH